MLLILNDYLLLQIRLWNHIVSGSGSDTKLRLVKKYVPYVVLQQALKTFLSGTFVYKHNKFYFFLNIKLSKICAYFFLFLKVESDFESGSEQPQKLTDPSKSESTTLILGRNAMRVRTVQLHWQTMSKRPVSSYATSVRSPWARLKYMLSSTTSCRRRFTALYFPTLDTSEKLTTGTVVLLFSGGLF